MSSHKSIDLTGQQLSDWTVIERAPSVKYAGSTTAMWLCKCICGKVKVITTRSLVTGTSSGCGCGRVQRAQAKNRKGAKRRAFKYFCYVYKRNAKQRNLPFLLTDVDIKIIISRSCIYCGALPIERVSSSATIAVKAKYPDYYNECTVLATGMDRLNNDEGYTIENTVSCCTTCNAAKSDMTHARWVEWLERLRKTNYIG